MHKHLKRLSRVCVKDPVYFITSTTLKRQRILANDSIAAILVREFEDARARHRWAIGSYVVMPDHVHFFCMPGPQAVPLSRFMGSWKEWTAKALSRKLSIPAPIWQERFFDHLMRSDESYAEKWEYVRDNPVRAGLAAEAESWPWQGHESFDSPL
mgnify:CR=1 FL=1